MAVLVPALDHLTTTYGPLGLENVITGTLSGFSILMHATTVPVTCLQWFERKSPSPVTLQRWILMRLRGLEMSCLSLQPY